MLKSSGISFLYDSRDTHKPGYKFNEHEIKGVPIRIVVGPKDIENSCVEIFRRDLMKKEIISFENISSKIDFLIEDIQKTLYNKAKTFRDNSIREVDTFDDFKKIISEKGGFVLAHWDGSSETEDKIKKETKATIRCIPIDNKSVSGKCIYSNKPSKQRVIFAKAY